VRRIRAIATIILPLKEEASIEYKNVIEADGELKKVPLDSKVPDKAVCINIETGLEEQAELLVFLDKNIDVPLALWESADMSSNKDCR
jgi:hypothetical protein